MRRLEAPRSSGPGLWQLLSACVLGLAIVIGTVITTRTIDYVKTFNTSLLTVTGTAKKIVTSDEVKWTGSYFVDTQLSALAPAYTQMDKDKAAVLAYLEGHGVPAAAITIAPVAMQQNFVNCQFSPKACGPSGPTSYRLEQTVRVQSPHVHRITSLAEDTSALVRSGVDFTTGAQNGPASQGLEYYYDKLASLRTQLLAAATRDAQKRAQQITASAGGRVGQLVSLSVEPFQLTPVDSTQISNSGAYSTSTISKKLTAIVRATFRLPQ